MNAKRNPVSNMAAHFKEQRVKLPFSAAAQDQLSRVSWKQCDINKYFKAARAKVGQ
jgi:hypothetical protein